MAHAAKKKSQQAKPKKDRRGVSTPRRAKARKKPVSARGASGAKKATRKATPKRAAKKVAKKAAPKVARKKLVKPIARKKPAPKRAPAPPAFARQKAGASPRELLQFELVRARAAFKAAVQGLASGSAMRPTAPGKWSPLEIVLHVSESDRMRLDEFDRVLAGVPRSWASITPAEGIAVNEANLAPLRAHTWEEAIRRLDSLRAELMERLAGVPDEPADVWSKGHAFGDMMWALPGHDRHHAMQIKNARIGGRAPVEA